MPFNLAEAGAAVGRDKSTILKAIKRGAISAARDPATNGWAIEPAELHRVFPPVAAATSRHRPATAEKAETAELRARAAVLEGVVDDLRRRLDEANAERRQTADRLAAAQERITALLMDQRAAPAPSRRWWRFGR